MNPILSNYQKQIENYTAVFTAHAKARSQRDQMAVRLQTSTASREQLRSAIVENPDLSTDSKVRAQLSTMLADVEMAAAALDGLSIKEQTAREVAGAAARTVQSALPGQILAVISGRVAQHEAAILALVRGLGPGLPDARVTLDVHEISGWCRHCLKAGHVLRSLDGFDEDNLIPPPILTEALNFISAQFAELPFPSGEDEAAEVEILTAA